MKNRPINLRRLSWPTLLTGLLWLAASPVAAQLPAAFAQAVPAADLARALSLAQQTAQALAPAEAIISTRLGTVDARLRPAPCARVDSFVPRGVPPWGATRIGLRCASGPVAWTLFVPVHVQVQAPALALKTALPAGQKVSEEHLMLATADWSARPQAPLTDAAQVLGRTLTRSVAAGAALREQDLKQRRWFVAGDRVKVVSGGAGFSVAAEGLALNDGHDGQRVRVQLLSGSGNSNNGNSGSQRGPIVQGQAVGLHRVELPL